LDHAGQLAGNTLVLTTSHGTRCVQSAREGACAVLVGSLPNASAAAKGAHHLARVHGCDVTLVAAGTADGSRAEEDDYAVAFLAGALAALGAEAHLAAPSSPAGYAFHQGAHGQRLVRLGYGKDVDLCASLDIFEVAGVLTQEGFVPMEAGP
jgi:2-phosphosulfolactate phosphatase